MKRRELIRRLIAHSCRLGEHDQLGASARAVATALMQSNWMVKHRWLLAKCIETGDVSPEEIHEFIGNRLNEQQRK